MNPSKYPRREKCKKCGQERLVPGRCDRCSLVSRSAWSTITLVATPAALMAIRSRAPYDSEGFLGWFEGLGALVMLGAGFVLVTVLLELFALARRRLRRRIK